MLRTEQLNYLVPPELIAQEPATPRDSSRLLVLHKGTGEIHHKVFRDLLEYLKPGDALVINNSRVIPARLTLADGRVVLLLRRTKGVWEALSEKGVFVEGDTFEFKGVRGVILSVGARAGSLGETLLRVSLQNEYLLQQVGEAPLPPYIHSYKGDPERYQTVYSQEQGSAAAPTAGLHFTPELLQNIKRKGVDVVEVTLHVSVDTFLPIAEENAAEHKIYTEYIQVTEEAAAQLRRAQGITCVGTTSVRTLEQMWKWKGGIEACEGFANIYILPGYTFHFDSLITNFHYPKSTNLLLASAFASPSSLWDAYRVAIEERYRFFSFGDAMLIVGGSDA